MRPPHAVKNEGVRPKSGACGGNTNSRSGNEASFFFLEIHKAALLLPTQR